MIFLGSLYDILCGSRRPVLIYATIMLAYIAILRLFAKFLDVISYDSIWRQNILHNLIGHEVGIIEEILLLPRDILWSWEMNDVNMTDFPQEVSLKCGMHVCA